MKTKMKSPGRAGLAAYLILAVLALVGVTAANGADTLTDNLAVYDISLLCGPVRMGVGEAPTNGLILYYDFNDSGATNIVDQSGSGNHGTLVGGPTWVTNGSLIGAYQFDGSDDEIDCGLGVDLNGASFSMALWAKKARPYTDEARYCIGQGQASTDHELFMGFPNFQNEKFQFGFYADDLYTDTAYNDTNWYHWVCTYDASDNARKIYCNGDCIASDTASGDYVGTGTLHVARRSTVSSQLFLGTIDEVRIYDRVLSDIEIVDLYGHDAESAVFSNASLTVKAPASLHHVVRMGDIEMGSYTNGL